ncbi:MAG: gamma-glutamylcyclotransferase, partial [Chloroflexi bacterium]|nr:gamma-glutamylcyclotransferase [Chloroflexota bacterium]
MTESLFVYGALMDPVVQQRVFGRVAPNERDRLVGYRKDQIRLGYGIVYPIIQ